MLTLVKNEESKEYTKQAYTKYHKNSKHYKQIDSEAIYDTIKSMGFSVEKTGAKNKHSEFSRHITSFVHHSEFAEGHKLRVIVDNSHDGSSSMKVRIGILRLVCSNGLMIGTDLVSPYVIRHTGNIDEKVAGLKHYMVCSVEKILECYNRLNQIILSDIETESLMRAFWMVRFGTLDNYRPFDRVRRSEDQMNTAWIVYNRLQERIMGNELVSRSRRITSLTRQVDLNTELFNQVLKVVA